MTNQPTQRTANTVLIACICINLCIGVLYAWSVIKSQLMAPVSEGGFGWSSTEAGIPYTVAIISLATAMLFGGRLQDKLGPRIVVMIGGALAGVGIALSGFVGNSLIGMCLCFGVLGAAGMGFGYGSVTPPAIKWFHPTKKGMISGLVVAGFGISPVYFAPLANMMMINFGIERALLFMGISIFVITVTAAQFIKNPPAGYVPPTPSKIKKATANASATAAAPPVDHTRIEMLRTPRFYLMFTMFLMTASVGLMFIGNMTKIAQTQVGITDSSTLALMVSFLAITNTLGRIVGGTVSDKIGRFRALYMVFIIQAVNLAVFMFYSNMFLLLIGIIGVGFCFGTLLSVFPALTADQYGLKNIGANYGVMFMAWGFAGLIAPTIANYLYDLQGNFNTAYIMCACVMVVMIFVNFVLQKNIAKLSA